MADHDLTIHYGERVRISTHDGRYLTAADQGEPWYMSEPYQKLPQNLFMLFERDHDRRDPLCFSGNFGADTLGAHGNFRIERTEAPKEEMMIASVDFNQVTVGWDCLFSGTTWGDAQDYETFLLFSTQGTEYTGVVQERMPFMMQNMRGSDDNSALMWFKDNKGQIKTFFETLGRDPKHGAPGDQVGHLWDSARGDDADAQAARAFMRKFVSLTPRWSQQVAGCFDNSTKLHTVFYLEKEHSSYVLA